jgi:hypothetical protein
VTSDNNSFQTLAPATGDERSPIENNLDYEVQSRDADAAKRTPKRPACMMNNIVKQCW